MTSMKRCYVCGLEFPRTSEFFFRRRDYKDGLAGLCKKCRIATDKLRRHQNPEQAKEKNRRAKVRYRERYPGRASKSTADWRARNPEKDIQYRATHKHKPYKSPPEKVRERTQCRKARIRNLPHTFTEADWQRALNYFDHRCAVCGASADLFTVLAQDHWIPLSKGGGYTPDNIIPLCHTRAGGFASCNNTKHNLDAYEWLVKTFGEKRADKINQRIHDYFASLKTP